MYFVKSFCLLKNVSLKNSVIRSVRLCNTLKLPAKNNASRLDFRSSVQNDVVLFTSKNTRSFIIMNALSFSNCIFWCYIGHFMLFTIKDTQLKYESKFWNWLIEKQIKYSQALGTITILFGLSAFFGTCFYTVHSVKSLVLLKGGKNLAITTYKFQFLGNSFQVPINEISACSPRAKSKSNLALKVKNKWFYYMIDMSGDFKNPSLFDFTAGVQRNF